MAARADAELDVKITALAGTCGLSRLLRETLEEDRTRRQGTGSDLSRDTLLPQLLAAMA